MLGILNLSSHLTDGDQNLELNDARVTNKDAAD